MTLLFVSGPEIFIVLIVVLLLFGSKKIPDVARGLGKGLNEFRRATDDIKRELNSSTEDVRKDISEFKDTVNKEDKE